MTQKIRAKIFGLERRFFVLQLFDDKGCNREVLDIRIRCKNHTSGCDWIGEIRDLEVYLV